MNLRQLDRKYLGRESLAEDLQVARTKGAFVYDARGRRYIDFLSGWCVGNFGWDNTAITKSPARRRPDYVYPEYLYRPWVELKNIRIRGMAIAVEAGEGEDYVSAITARCNRNGLLVTTSGNAITMFPPLTLDRRTAKAGLDILEKSLL